MQNYLADTCFPFIAIYISQGNVEYKLRLLNPSAERFTRLVTQLKWRLLEGGGQAYYELGVADSGQLVGLSREHLEQSLQTLEEMAGEIGASVIIVKEIEIPAGAVTKETRGRIADGAMRMQKKRVIADSTRGFAGTYDTETSTPELEEEDIDETANKGSTQVPFERALFPLHHRTFPERPSSQSSPVIQPTSATGNSAESEDFSNGDVFALDFEISSVYKPRPHRRRTPVTSISPASGPVSRIPTASVSETCSMDPDNSTPRSEPDNVNLAQHGRTFYNPKKISKNKHRKRLNKGCDNLDDVPKLVVCTEPSESTDQSSIPSTSYQDTSPLSSDALEDLERAAALLAIGDVDEEARSLHPCSLQATASTRKLNSSGISVPAETTVIRDLSPVPVGASSHTSASAQMTSSAEAEEHWFIVEALVVRKLSLEEAYLDFGNL